MNNREWKDQCDNSTKVLLVEGPEDCYIINKFCKNNTIKENSFDFCKCGNDSQVLEKLGAILKESYSSMVEVVGVILDADNDIQERYNQIKLKLNKYKTLPKTLPKDGLVITETDLPKLGIWIMPNNQDNGALEEFYLELATNIDTDFIDKVITEAETKGLTSFKSQHRNKAIMHTYFAWQDKPNAPLYSAVNKIALNNNHEIAKNFKNWLEKLFN